MIKWLSNLLIRSSQVKNETVDLANTADRVGQLLIDLAKASVLPYDANVGYEAGQFAVFDGVLAEAVQSTLPGESPVSAKFKWSLKLVVDPAQITESNTMPVSAAALAKYQPGGESMSPVGRATEEEPGIERRATQQQVDEGLIDDAYVSPKKNKRYIDKLFNDFVRPTFDSVLAENPNSNRPFVHGPSGEQSPFFVDNVQAVQIAYQQNTGGTWFKVLITWDKLISLIKKQIGLTDVLATSNVSDGTAVLGGLGLFQRVNVPTATKYPVFVPGPVIGGKQVNFIEQKDEQDMLSSMFQNASEDTKTFIYNVLNRTDATVFVGTVIGVRCIDVAGAGDALERFFLISDAVIGTVQTHGLATPGDRIQPYLTGPDGRIDTILSITFPTPDQYLLEYPDADMSDFTGKLTLKAYPAE